SNVVASPATACTGDPSPGTGVDSSACPAACWCSDVTLASCRGPQAFAQASGKRGSEVQVRDAIIEHQLPDGARHLHLPFKDDVRSINDIERLLHIVICDQYSDPTMT